MSSRVKKLLMGSGATKDVVFDVYDYQESKAGIEAHMNGAVQEFNSRWSNPVQDKVQFEDFHLFRTLGTGAFGRVMLVQHKTTLAFYAIKILNKEKIIKVKQVEHTLNEKRILQAVKFPFLIKLDYFFKDNCNLYLVLEFVTGGEMFTYLRKTGKFTEQQAKVFAAQVTLVFEYLHALDILYRDLKPENILIDCTGFLKVTDMGFAKRVTGRTYTLCGTPEYLAPELILNKGYGRSVDWWTLGILIFEMVAGNVPFSANEHMTIYEKIVAGSFKCPRFFSEDLKDICRHLIQADLTRRYGILKNGELDIKTHAWFRSVNWLATYERKVIPTYIPKCKSVGDASNFQKFEEEDLRTSPTNQYAEAFKDF